MIDYEGKTFIAVANSESGEVSDRTTFRYHQDGDLFWAEYAGGMVRLGFMVGLAAPDGTLAFSYQHVNSGGEIRTGRCASTPEVLPDGRIRLHERWQWTNGSLDKGESVVEEVAGSTETR